MKPTYIQRANEFCVNILDSWGITTQETPVNVYPEPKELSKRAWEDQDGDDVHYGDRAYYKSYQQKWKFIYIGEAGSANENVRQFLLYLQNADFSIFSEYTMMGARCVYNSSSTESFLRREQDYLSFTIELTVIKPLSRGVYFGGLPTSIKAECDTNIYLANGDVKILKKNDVYITAPGNVFGIFIPLGVEEARGGIIDGNNVLMLARRTLSGVTNFASAYSAIKDMDLRYGEVGVSAYLDEIMQPSILMCIGINDNDPIPMATLSVVEALKSDYTQHKTTKAIHRTSAEVRSEIVDADIPNTLARIKQLNDAIALVNGGATEQYNTLAKLQAKIENITSVLSGDDGDAIIETLQEALSFINEHKESIDSLVGTYVAKTSIADNLTTSDAGKVLSAKQGVALKLLITTLERNINTALGDKVDKVDGKQLSSNNFSDEYKGKLDGVATGANNYQLPAATGLAIGGVKPGEGLAVDPDGTIRVILNGVVDPSMMVELEEPSDADELLTFRSKTTSHIFSLGGLFSWIKGKFTAPLGEGKKVAKFLVIDDEGNTSAIAESTLAPVPAIDQIDHFRIITKSGGSRKATPAQAAEMVGNNGIINFGRNDLLSTEQLVQILSDRGAFTGKYWTAKIAFAYATNPRVQTHSVGVLNLAGAVIECWGSKTDYEIRISTVQTSQVDSDLRNCEVTYVNNSNYAPGWSVKAKGGTDYSLLTEQIVPGEFAYNLNQERSQVYVRSFIATTRDGFDYTQLPLTLPNSGCVIAAFGSVVGGTIWAYPITAASIIRYTSAYNWYGFTHAYSFADTASGVIPPNATVYLTVKYVK